ncbi:MAG: restriction endonuclease subunit S, partial [Spirochaetales bacterium]|nr:restriction endonuclease subunit S [Spirochaetales bacterium]MDD7767892.1 restriction endonuclease subunit S [Treponema sp.]MDY5913678.1 restriction endonuclease subunit S [Treponema sp.]
NGIRIPLAESKFKIAPAESTLLCIEGGSAGRKIGFINQDVCFVNKLCCFHSDQLSNLYLFYYLQSRTFIDLFNSNKSGLIGGVSLNLLKSIFIPVAPAIEQDLISKTIATYLEKITTLNKDKETLELTIKKAKSKILDLAIHGKLVPQNPNDEAASVLLEKLRAEKEEKNAKGELKRDKNDSFIYKGSDNCYYEKFKNSTIEEIDIPFEIPDTWCWCRLRDIVYDLGDGIHGTPKYDDKGQYYFINGNNLLNGKIEIKQSTKRVSETEYKKYKKNLVTIHHKKFTKNGHYPLFNEIQM